MKKLFLVFALFNCAFLLHAADPERLNRELLDAAAIGDVDQVEELLDAGANINAQDDTGYTLLMIAALNGYTEIAELLIEAGANLNMQNDNRSTALMMAVYSGRIKIVKALIKAKADLNIQNKYGRTALMMVAGWGHKKVAEELLAAGAEKGTAADVAEQEGHDVLAEFIRTYGGRKKSAKKGI